MPISCPFFLFLDSCHHVLSAIMDNYHFFNQSQTNLSSFKLFLPSISGIVEKQLMHSVPHILLLKASLKRNGGLRLQSHLLMGAEAEGLFEPRSLKHVIPYLQEKRIKQPRQHHKVEPETAACFPRILLQKPEALGLDTAWAKTQRGFSGQPEGS